MKIAAVVTVWSKNSHADVIVGKFLRGFPTDDGVLPPKGKVVSLYMDQVGGFGHGSRTANFAAREDLGTALAAKYGVKLCGSITEALCLGGDEVAGDNIHTAVLPAQPEEAVVEFFVKALVRSQGRPRTTLASGTTP